MNSFPRRFAKLVLVTPVGDPLGVLPAIPVQTPWWQDARPVVEAARQAFRADVTILRMLEVDNDGPAGGLVTYLAEADGPVVAAEPWHGTLTDHPLRMSWARPGGPAADIAWADGVLAERGIERVGPAEQVRTWNLSSVWRMPVANGAVWLKHVAPFFAHEGSILERLAGRPVPTLVGHDGARSLLADIPGEDLYEAQPPLLERMVSMLVGLQRESIGTVEELLALGLPDWRAPALTTKIGDVVERTVDLAAEDRTTVAAFVDTLPDRFAEIAACGLPDTLVHGDFAPGNTRGDERSFVLLDWGDSGVGHPLLDQAAFLERIPADASDPVVDHWAAEWQRAVPGSDPQRATELLAPAAAARQAVTYRLFLDNIEPSEHPYHRLDPARSLARTATLVRQEVAATGG